MGGGPPNSFPFQMGKLSEGWWLTEPLREVEPTLKAVSRHSALGHLHLISCQWGRSSERAPRGPGPGSLRQSSQGVQAQELGPHQGGEVRGGQSRKALVTREVNSSGWFGSQRVSDSGKEASEER